MPRGGGQLGLLTMYTPYGGDEESKPMERLGSKLPTALRQRWLCDQAHANDAIPLIPSDSHCDALMLLRTEAANFLEMKPHQASFVAPTRPVFPFRFCGGVKSYAEIVLKYLHPQEAGPQGFVPNGIIVQETFLWLITSSRSFHSRFSHARSAHVASSRMGPFCKQQYAVIATLQRSK